MNPATMIHTQTKSLLCCLPEELLIHVLYLTEPVDLLACLTVCRLLCKLVEDTMVLQYRIELYAGGMIDGPSSCPLPVAERLSLLRSRRRAWNALNLDHRETPLIPGSWSAYELVDGIFSKTIGSSEHQSARGILFTSLPSRDTQGSLIVRENVGIPFRDFAMDPTQDLIVYMKCTRMASVVMQGTHVTLYFRTISTNKIHPGAKEPFVSVRLPTDVLGAVIQTVDEILGFMCWDNGRAQLYIWDWTQGTMLVAENALAPLDDFAFISSRAYVLTSPIPDPCFRVYTFDTTGPPTLCATLRLPPIQDDAVVSLLGIHTGPFTSTSAQPHGLRLGPPKPFVRAASCRIHIIHTEVRGPLEAPASCLLVVHNRTFLAYVSRAERENELGPVDVPWHEWGPNSTRWLMGGTGSQWLRYVHGERFVRLHAPSDNAPRNLEVYDFGAPRGPTSWLTPEEKMAAEAPSTLRFDTVFAEPIISRLPCRVISKQGYFPYSGLMVDEERIVALKRHWADDLENVDVFPF